MEVYNYFQFFKESVGNRDTVFNYVLEIFGKKPISILEIGCTRNLDHGARMGDGWSSLHFYDYISTNGGQLDIVDLDQSAISICNLLLSSHPNYPNNVTLTVDYGRNLITKKYDLIYLDGGDDPNEMVEEYELIQKVSPNAVILCDDFHAKGSLLRLKYPNYELIKWHGNSHEMAIYSILSSPIVTVFNTIQK